ncbi:MULTISPECIES: hypothetical protein [unclassified Caballeronia]|uniref:DUF7665 family protein n=1 Tax=unclassified Caballeronia TaxID=2646786 RepID=UPI0028651E8D|nr:MULTISPECIES: hypothetical protein [unclassified Caballeronia]MDR5751293.1 hypothetical protein [Caballeronia sp. LZ024]MDR5844569.1 hypothetical protein [Caballeronia sp. LZ031]
MSAPYQPVNPDARAFQADINGPLFQMGVADGRWQLVSLEWPYAVIEVTAAVGAFALRFELAGFPVKPPTAQPWDVALNAPLAHNKWPGSRGGRVRDVFRTDWLGGTALYIACDRRTIEGHQNWVTQMPARLWKPDGSIVTYLEEIHALLNSPDFSPPLVAAA